ncbi:hypothetical protein EKK58_05485 [Candidatus Dependentiae bacterium]|nr:MAG: hypothetical protein EKK58_05485 [Candidatus Dependentiae bacterium]
MDSPYVSYFLVDVARAIRGPLECLWTLDSSKRRWILGNGFWCGPLHVPAGTEKPGQVLHLPAHAIQSLFARHDADWRFSRIAAAASWAGIDVIDAMLIRDMNLPGIAIVAEWVVVAINGHKFTIVRSRDDATRLAILILSAYPAEAIVAPTLLERAARAYAVPSGQMVTIRACPIHA